MGDDRPFAWCPRPESWTDRRTPVGPGERMNIREVAGTVSQAERKSKLTPGGKTFNTNQKKIGSGYMNR